MIELVIRIAFSLAVVLGLMWGLAKLARRPMAASRGGGMLSVLARQQLTKGAAVAVVRVADRALVLGVTDAGVSLLGDTDLDTLEEYRQEPVTRRERIEVPPADRPSGADGPLDGSVLSPGTWRQTVDFVRERTARR